MIFYNNKYIKSMRSLKSIACDSGTARYMYEDGIVDIMSRNNEASSKPDVNSIYEYILYVPTGGATDDERYDTYLNNFNSMIAPLFPNLAPMTIEVLLSNTTIYHHTSWLADESWANNTDFEQLLQDAINDGTCQYLNDDGTIDPTNFGNLTTPQQFEETYDDATGEMTMKKVYNIIEGGTAEDTNYTISQKRAGTSGEVENI